MNIANIFGLHLNCKVRCQFVGNKTSWDVIRRVREVSTFYIEAQTDDGFVNRFEFDKCKLILKPLSKITDEDKAEFQTTFKIKEKILGFDISSSGAVLVCTEFGDFDGDPMDKYDDISYAQILWLASKGYDIGLVPDEYKEVEE